MGRYRIALAGPDGRTITLRNCFCRPIATRRGSFDSVCQSDKGRSMSKMRILLDHAILTIVNAFLYLRHPVWLGRTALRLHRLPNVAAPKSFREKRMWRLIFDRNPLLVMFGDKLATKAWMTDRAPELISAPTIWIAENASDLQNKVFAKGIVIKASRGCGQNIFIDDESSINSEMYFKINKWMNRSYYEKFGKKYWPRIDQIIFAEKYIDSNRKSILDLNLFCCDGRVLFFVVTSGEKTKNEKVAYFSADGRRVFSIEASKIYIKNWLPSDFELPNCFERAVELASKLSRSIDFVRVDLMYSNDQLYACEMTPFPGVGSYMQAGFVEAQMRDWDLQKSWFVQTEQRAFTRTYQKALQRWLVRKAQSPAMPQASGQLR